ncbi:MAG TPA: CorA family divalent cation transporter [Chitinophagaceae bacterium]
MVASIYGMNVPIPYQHSANAFWIPILFSLGISLIIGWFFLRKKIF